MTYASFALRAIGQLVAGLDENVQSGVAIEAQQSGLSGSTFPKLVSKPHSPEMQFAEKVYVLDVLGMKIAVNCPVPPGWSRLNGPLEPSFKTTL